VTTPAPSRMLLDRNLFAFIPTSLIDFNVS